VDGDDKSPLSCSLLPTLLTDSDLAPAIIGGVDAACDDTPDDELSDRTDKRLTYFPGYLIYMKKDKKQKFRINIID
jgi:hypothetical protein